MILDKMAKFCMDTARSTNTTYRTVKGKRYGYFFDVSDDGTTVDVWVMCDKPVGTCIKVGTFGISPDGVSVVNDPKRIACIFGV